MSMPAIAVRRVGAGWYETGQPRPTEETTMRFLTLIKAAEGSGQPPAALMDAMGKFIEEAASSGVLHDTGGLMPSATGARVRLAGGKLKVTDGPFAEAKELVGGYALLELPSKEAAIESSRQLLELHRQHWPGWEGEVEIRQVMPEPDSGPQA
jgi:hypothetical protein